MVGGFYQVPPYRPSSPPPGWKQLKELACGDVVKLKSGGPLMVVANPSNADGIACQWFHGDGFAQTGTFQADMLLLSTPTE